MTSMYLLDSEIRALVRRADLTRFFFVVRLRKILFPLLTLLWSHLPLSGMNFIRKIP